MVPLIGFLVLVIDLYIWVVIASAILSWLIAFNVVNTSNRFVYSVAETLYRLTEPALRPIRSSHSQSRRHRHLAGDSDPVPAVPARCGAARLDSAGRGAPAHSLSEASARLALRRVAAGIMLPVRLTPKSSRDEIGGIAAFGGEAVLKARVRALPEDGRANEALAKLIARWLKLPPSCVSVAQGGKSRMKQVLVEGDAATLAPLIEARLADLAG